MEHLRMCAKNYMNKPKTLQNIQSGHNLLKGYVRNYIPLYTYKNVCTIFVVHSMNSVHIIDIF